MIEEFRKRLRWVWVHQEPLRFLVLGAFNTAMGYLLFTGAFVLVAGRIHYLAILVGTHFLAVLNAFLCHKYLTFQVQGNFFLDFLRFNLTYLGSLAVGLVGLPLLVEGLRFHPLFAQPVVLTCSLVGSYFLHKRFSFRRKSNEPASGDSGMRDSDASRP